jgi:DNA-binding NarL/FixJ family response regulator
MATTIDIEMRTVTRTNRAPIQIWLVDDSSNYRVLLADLLGSEHGLECTQQFPSAEAVLEALSRDQAPHVILLDIRMPGMTGLEAVRHIKRLARATHVLMLTTFFDSLAQTQALRDGASGLLLKTFPFEEIVRNIREVCARPFTNSFSAALIENSSETNCAASLDAPPRPKHRASETTGRCPSGETQKCGWDNGLSNLLSRCISSRLARGIRWFCRLVPSTPKSSAADGNLVPDH